MNKYQAWKAYQQMVYSQKRKREELEFYHEQAEWDAEQNARKLFLGCPVLSKT